MTSKDIYGGYGSNPVYETLLTEADIRAREAAKGKARDTGYSTLLDDEAMRLVEKRKAFEQLINTDSPRLNLPSDPLAHLNALKQAHEEKLAKEAAIKQAEIEKAKEEVAHAALIEDEMYRNSKMIPSVEEVASLVIKGQLGNGRERVNNIRSLGVDPRAVQSLVNKLMRGY